MKLGYILHNRKLRIFAISIFFLLLIYTFLRLALFETDPIIPFLSSITNSYLLLIEKCANLLLLWTGSPVTIQNHNILLNGTQLTGFTTLVMYKKAVPFFLLLFWLTQTSISKKIWFTILLVAVSFLFLSIDNAVGAHFASSFSSLAFVSIPHSIGYLSMSTILFIWYWDNKKSILNSLSKLPLNTEQLEKKIIKIFVSIFIYILVIEFSYSFFDFNLLIDFIFKSSQKILSLLGHKAVVAPHLLIGENGSIQMEAPCLGFETMFLFAWIVYFTGNDNKIRWIYIIFGLLFLFVVNIMRFVFLFIHIQKHGDYVLAMSVHDMYNYITYLIVLVLWIIWFEKFADIRSSKRNI